MKPLIVLLTAFGISLLLLYLFYHAPDAPLAGRIAMAIMLFFTASAHFAFRKGMVAMIPAIVPFKTQLVILTGLLEIAGGIGLLWSRFANTTGWLLIVFFLCLLPANINAAMLHLDYQKGTLTGPGLKYLWFRIPLQLFFMAWILFFVLLH